MKVQPALSCVREHWLYFVNISSHDGHSLRLLTGIYVDRGLFDVDRGPFDDDRGTHCLLTGSLTSSRSPVSSLSASLFWRLSMYRMASRMMSSCVTLSLAETLGISSFNLQSRKRENKTKYFRILMQDEETESFRWTNEHCYFLSQKYKLQMHSILGIHQEKY